MDTFEDKNNRTKMPISTESLETTLLKHDSKNVKKIRRKIINLYRPIKHDKSESIWNQPLLVYLMFSLFICSGLLLFFGVDQPAFSYPFLIGWVLTFVSLFYLRIFPHPCAALYDSETVMFIEFHRTSNKCEPMVN